MKFFEHTGEEVCEDIVIDEDIVETLAEFDREFKEDRKRAAIRAVNKKKSCR